MCQANYITEIIISGGNLIKEIQTLKNKLVLNSMKFFNIYHDDKEV